MANLQQELRFKTITGVHDPSVLYAAGIHTIRDYISTDLKTISKLTKQRVREAKNRQRAAQIYLRSGLDPGLCLKMVQAGARNSCEILALNTKKILKKDDQKLAVEQAKINVAYENLREFIHSTSSGSKQALLEALAKLKPAEKTAAFFSFKTLCTLPQFRWLDREVGQVMDREIETRDLKKVIELLSEEKISMIVGQINAHFQDGG